MSTQSKKELWAFTWIALVLVACRAIGSIVLPVYDDAFITFRYSRNLAEGNGLVYHVGERVLGTTSPGFGLLCALFYWLGLPMPQTVVAMNIALDVLVFGVTLCVLPKSARYLAGIVFGTLFAVSPILTRISVGGMEMNLYLLCSLLSIVLYLRQFKKTAVALAAVCFYLRPEALALLSIFCAQEWFYGERRDALEMGLIAVAVLAAPLIVLHLFYGQVIPQSLIAKAGLERPTVWGVLQKLLTPDPLIFGLIPLAVWGFVATAKADRFVRVVGVWCLIYVMVYTLARQKVWSWYGEPIYYAILLLAALGSIDLVQRLPQAIGIWFRRLSPLMGALAVAAWMIVWVRVGPSGVTRHIYEPLAVWCKENIQSGTSILAYDIGAVGYYSNARIYDMAGLVWPQALALTDVEVIQTFSPDYLFLNATQGTAELMSSTPLDALYRPVIRFSKTGATDLGLNVERYSADWVQDYIVFQKQSQRLDF